MTTSLLANHGEDVTRELATELMARLRGMARADEVVAQVRTALADLRGSVAPESIFEMAARLAYHRLTDTTGLRDIETS